MKWAFPGCPFVEKVSLLLSFCSSAINFAYRQLPAAIWCPFVTLLCPQLPFAGISFISRGSLGSPPGLPFDPLPFQHLPSSAFPLPAFLFLAHAPGIIPCPVLAGRPERDPVDFTVNVFLYLDISLLASLRRVPSSSIRFSSSHWSPACKFFEFSRLSVWPKGFDYVS